MEIEGEKPSSLPSNYVTIHQLKERWLQQQQQSPSKPEHENPKPKPKPKPNENAIKPTNTQNQRPNYGRVTKEHKPKEGKVDDIGSTSKTLVVEEMKNPNKNDATKHNQRPNYRPVTNKPKFKVDDNGSTSKTLVADDLKNLRIKPNEIDATKPKADDDGSSFKTLVVGVTDNKIYGENETGHSNFDTKKKKKKKYKKLQNPKVVTDQNPTGAEQEPEVEMVEEKGKEGRRYGCRNGNSRFGAELERKMEPEQEAEVVEEKMEKKSCPTDKTPEVEMVEGKGKEWRRYGRRNGNSTFGAEPERTMEPEQEAEVVEEKMEKKSYGRRKSADKNLNGAELKPEMEEEVVVEKGKRGRRYGRGNGNSRVVWEQKEKTAPVDGNGGDDGGGGGGDGVVEEVVKERNVGQGRDRFGGYERFQKRVPRGSFGEQKGQIWVKKGESVVPN
nr:hypothetical protein [Tanacetum cinerariifolium]